MFNLNVGGFDRIFRVVGGIVLLALSFFALSGIWSIVVGVFGAIFLVTGAIGWCPLYLPFKFSTRKS